MNTTRSFPLIRELPKIIDTCEWTWKKPPLPDHEAGMNLEWWIGTDLEGGRWLVKMSNGMQAYREHVFASLAQRLGVSCQSSSYVLIGSNFPAPRLVTLAIDPCQLAIWWMEEHAEEPCSGKCPWLNYHNNLRSRDYLKIRQASIDGVAYFEDLVRADALGYLCGQFEPHDHFLTSRHEYVVIDNELMFSAHIDVKPSLNGCRWNKFEAARALITEVCRDLVGIADEELRNIAELPVGYSISNGRDLYPDLRKAKVAAAEYLESAGNS